VGEALTKKTEIDTPHIGSPSLPSHLAWRIVSRPFPFLHYVKVADSLPLSTSPLTFTILSF